MTPSIEQISLDYPEATAPLSRRGRRHRRDSLQRCLDQIRHGPYPVSQAERHRWRHPQGFVRAAQIVKRDVQADRRKVAIDLFREPVAEPREPL